jgi:hypothetical protein
MEKKRSEYSHLSEIGGVEQGGGFRRILKHR